jgi:hypothetical protein
MCAFTICATPTPVSAVAAGLGRPIIGKLLGHSQPSTTARYAHLDADPLRSASEVIAGHIATAMGEVGVSHSQ